MAIRSHLRPLLRLAKQSLRDRRSVGLGGSTGAGGSAAGRGFAGRPLVERDGLGAAAGRLARFNEVTGGDGIEAYRTGARLPLTFGAVWETPLVLELLAEAGAGLPLRGLVHLESELVQIRPIRTHETVRMRLEVAAMEPATQGVRLTLDSRIWNRADQLCREGSTTILLRSAEGAIRRRSGRSDRERPAEGPFHEVRRWYLESDLGRRYARASGDFNPIHLWAITARPFGFRRAILQGFCTRALVANSLIETLGGGDPDSLRRLSIRFRSPLFLPASVRLLVAPLGEAAAAFRVVDAADETRLHAEGRAVCGASPPGCAASAAQG